MPKPVGPDTIAASFQSAAYIAMSTHRPAPPEKPRVLIRYCPLCGWLLRSSWMAQELLTTFQEELGEVTLQPAGSGLFEIWVDDTLIWCRKRDGGFPDIKILKQRVRDQVCPDRSLGHSDKTS